MKTTLISAYYQNELMTQDFLKNLEGKLPKDTEVILVNAGSKPIENPILTERVDLLFNKSFATSFNSGLRRVNSDYTCIINNDAFPKTTDWLEKLVDLAEETGAWVTAPSNDKSNITDYTVFDSQPDYWQVAFFPAVCWLISRECLEKVGFFDEQFLGGNFEDNDYCERVHQANGKVVVSKKITINHIGSQTVRLLDNDKLMRENYQRFRDKWG